MTSPDTSLREKALRAKLRAELRKWPDNADISIDGLYVITAGELAGILDTSEAKDRCIEALEADNAKLESDNARLRGAISEAADCLDGEPEYHDQGMGCGLEDRGITDRYDAMAHGWEKAMERVYGENIAWAKDVLSSALSGKEGQS